MKINKKAIAKWSGSLKEGKGSISLESGAFDSQPYGFNTRFEDKPGTNPEELIGGAHAACFSMAFSNILGEENFKPTNIETECIITLEKQGEGFDITKSHLKMTATIPDISKDKFTELANKAKENCPISKVLKTDISMEATLS